MVIPIFIICIVTAGAVCEPLLPATSHDSDDELFSWSYHPPLFGDDTFCDDIIIIKDKIV